MANETLRRDETDPDYRPEAGAEPEVRTGPEAGSEFEARSEPEARSEFETPSEPEARSEFETPGRPEPHDGLAGEPAGGPAYQPGAEAGAVTSSAQVPGPVGTEPDAALWPEQDAEQVQERWRELQLRFVDDPRAAAEQAQALVTETLDSFTSALASRKRELDAWHDNNNGAGGGDADTERMRTVVRRYRNLLDRLLTV